MIINSAFVEPRQQLAENIDRTLRLEPKRGLPDTRSSARMQDAVGRHSA